jgi:hypothetical protein
METSKEILTELQEIAPFLGRSGISKISYSVPYGYFDEFMESLMTRIRTQAAGPVAETGAVNVESLSPYQEIAGISPLLAGIPKKTPYEVPDGYFASWEPKIPVLSVVETENTLSELVTMASEQARAETVVPEIYSIGHSGKRRNFSALRVVRYAAAACIIGFLGIGIYKMSGHATTDPINGLTAVTDLDLSSYLDSGAIQMSPDISSYAETASLDFSDNDVHELLISVPDVELEQYSPALAEQKPTVN